MDDQIDPGDNFFGVDLSDCVTVPANLSSNAHTEAQDALKRPFGQVADVVTVTEEMVAAAITAYLAHDGDWPEEIPAMYRAMAAVAPNPRNVPYEEYDKLITKLAAQALAHAEQMEGAQQALKKLRVAELEAENAKLTLALAGQNIHAQQIAMRVTPATQPTDAQQTVGDVKAAPERRPDGTLKPVARAWEAPKRLTDVRRLGG